MELEGTHSGAGRGLGTRGQHSPDSTRIAREQFSLFDEEHPVITRIRELDLNSLTPLDALNLLARLKTRVSDPSAERK